MIDSLIMNKLRYLKFTLCMALGLLSSCVKDTGEYQSVATGGGDKVELMLSAEVSLQGDEARALNFKLDKNAKHAIVPMPQFKDKQEVPVHTIVKSSKNDYAIRTLTWCYDAPRRKLVLKQSAENSIPVSGFNNDAGTKWYVSGLIGGDLKAGTTEVSFAGTRVLNGVNGAIGDVVGALNVPYAFGWTELVIQTNSKRETGNSYSLAYVPFNINLKFQPLGALIACKFGTNQSADGNHSFIPGGFSLKSNTWGDTGTFQLNTSIPSFNPRSVLPVWTELNEVANLDYTFAEGHAPGKIEHGKVSDKTYYMWVMPHKTQPETRDVQVMMKGESSRSFRHYTKVWFTDYRLKTDATKGKNIESGKVYSLTARVTSPLRLPIESVAEYNLAGGPGLTVTAKGMDPQLDGIRGPLRFASSHRTDQSGYYSWHAIERSTNNPYNSEGRPLQDEVDKTFGEGNYFIPYIEHLWGVFPTDVRFEWREGFTEESYTDYIQIGFGDEVYRARCRSQYLEDMYFRDNNRPLYGIRFQAEDDARKFTKRTFYDLQNKTKTEVPYYPIQDDMLKCAYRYRRGFERGIDGTNKELIATMHMAVDVVYLGVEATPTSLSDISNEAWWKQKEDSREVITVKFPAAGVIWSSDTSGYLTYRGAEGYYRSATPDLLYPPVVFFFMASPYHYGNAFAHDIGLSIRLFKHLK